MAKTETKKTNVKLHFGAKNKIDLSQVSEDDVLLLTQLTDAPNKYLGTNANGEIITKDLPTIPTATSDLTNDSGFITSSYHDNTKQDVSTIVADLRTAGFLTLQDLPIWNGDIE